VLSAAIKVVFRPEKRNQYAYLITRDLGLFAGRALCCLLFLTIAYWVSGIAALRYVLPVAALLQLLAIRVAGQISLGLEAAVLAPLLGVCEPAAELM